ncbi:MAG TPA: hypothetical protein VJU13_06325, partial [Candidatus Nitrosocosmicus sp.]|nr:hypothetical protein [Candidatus Nitrosocosmicus sp.]
LSNNGFKAVSTSGEIFFPNLSLMQFDYGSKIADVTKDLLLSDSIENLKNNIEKLQELTKIRIAELDVIARERTSLREIRDTFSLEKSDIIKNINELENLLAANIKNLDMLYAINKEHSTRLDDLFRNFNYSKKRFKIITNTNIRVNNEMKNTDERIDTQKIMKIEDEERDIVRELDIVNSRLNQLKLTHSMVNNNIENTTRAHNKSLQEDDQIKIEKIERNRILEKAISDGKDIESELRTLREKEDEIIQATSTTYARLQEYETEIKKLTELEKKLGKESNQLEKDIGFLRKDILDLEYQKMNQSNDLARLGHKTLLESFDVDNLYRELKEEYESIRDKVNFRADETYLEIIEGYRGLSDKRNHLEEERNSIVNFIEEIGKEKENLFTEAFKKVDDDIRKTFSDITGGNAYLELEDPDNIFSGGILLMVQFPNKPARESTSLSGGEKTMAAIVFLLALQSLKPSPFYLMDEVDAHLDAQNTERLSKILLLRSVNNQIIMVTLKDSTVAKSDLIFGVYPKNGISQVVKYNHPSKVKLEVE